MVRGESPCEGARKHWKVRGETRRGSDKHMVTHQSQSRKRALDDSAKRWSLGTAQEWKFSAGKTSRTGYVSALEAKA